MLREQPEQRVEGVAVGGAFVLLLRSRVGAVENATPLENRFLARLGQSAIGIAAEREPTHAAMMAI
jgi:hypothetical protein